MSSLLSERNARFILRHTARQTQDTCIVLAILVFFIGAMNTSASLVMIGAEAASDCTGWAVFSGYPVLTNGYHFQAVQCTLRNPFSTVGVQIPAGPRTLVTRVTITDSAVNTATALRIQGSTNEALEATQPAVFVLVTRTTFTQGFLTIAGAFAPHSRVDVIGNTFAITNANNPININLGIIQVYAPTPSEPVTLHSNSSIRVDENAITATFSTQNTYIFNPMDMVIKSLAGYSFSGNQIQLSCPSSACWVVHSYRPTYDTSIVSMASQAFVKIDGNTIQGAVENGRCIGLHWQLLTINPGTINAVVSISENTVTWSAATNGPLAFTLPSLNVVDALRVVYAVLRNKVTFPSVIAQTWPSLLSIRTDCCSINNIVRYTSPTPPALANRFHIRVESNTLTVSAAAVVEMTAVSLQLNAAFADVFDGMITVAHNVINRPANAKLTLLSLLSFRSTYAASSALGPSVVVVVNNTLKGNAPHAILIEATGFNVFFGGSSTPPLALAPASALRPFYACRNVLRTSPKTIDELALPVGSWVSGSAAPWTTSRDVCFDTESQTASLQRTKTLRIVPSPSSTVTKRAAATLTPRYTTTPSKYATAGTPTESAATKTPLWSFTKPPTSSVAAPTMSVTRPQPSRTISAFNSPSLLPTATRVLATTHTQSLSLDPPTATRTLTATGAPISTVTHTLALTLTTTSTGTMTPQHTASTTSVTPTAAKTSPSATHVLAATPCIKASAVVPAPSLTTTSPTGVMVDIALPAALLRDPTSTATHAAVMRLLPPGSCPTALSASNASDVSPTDACATDTDPFWVSYLHATTATPLRASDTTPVTCHAASATVLRCVLPPVPPTAAAAIAWLQDKVSPTTAPTATALASFILPHSLLAPPNSTASSLTPCGDPLVVSITLGVWRPHSTGDDDSQVATVTVVLAAGAAADVLLLLVDPTACQSLALAALYLGGCTTDADVHAARAARFLLSPAVTAGPAAVVAVHVGAVAVLVSLEVALFLRQRHAPVTSTNMRVPTITITTTITPADGVLLSFASVAAVLLYPGVGWGTARLVSSATSYRAIVALVVGSVYLIVVPAAFAWLLIRRLDVATVTALRQDLCHPTPVRRLLLPAEHWPLMWRKSSGRREDGDVHVSAGLLSMDTELAEGDAERQHKEDEDKEDHTCTLYSNQRHSEGTHTSATTLTTIVRAASTFWVRGQARFRFRLLPCVVAALYVLWCALVVAPRPVTVTATAVSRPSRQCVGISLAAAVVAFLCAVIMAFLRPYRTLFTTVVTVTALLLVAFTVLAHALQLHSNYSDSGPSSASQAWATAKAVCALLVAVLSVTRTVHAAGVIFWESRQHRNNKLAAAYS